MNPSNEPAKKIPSVTLLVLLDNDFFGFAREVFKLTSVNIEFGLTKLLNDALGVDGNLVSPDFQMENVSTGFFLFEVKEPLSATQAILKVFSAARIANKIRIYFIDGADRALISLHPPGGKNLRGREQWDEVLNRVPQIKAFLDVLRRGGIKLNGDPTPLDPPNPS